MIVLLPDRTGWSVGRFTADGPAVERVVAGIGTPDECARQLRESLARIGYAGEAVLLAIASAECLARRATMEDPALARDRTALAYAWEVWFPSAAEDLVMDFVVTGQDVLGVAVRTASFAPLVQALEDLGISVESIVPAALLALQGATASLDIPAPTAPSSAWMLVLWGNGDDIELVLVKDGRPADWRIVPANARSLKRELEVLSLVADSPLEVVAFDLSTAMREVISTVTGVQLRGSGSQSFAISAITAAHDVLTRVSVPWVELRRGDLAATDPYRPVRGAIRLATLAGFVFLLTLSTALWVRSERYEQEVIRCQSQQEDLFREVFPGRALPVGVRSRLESEHTRLAGSSGSPNDATSRTSALETLDEVLSALPNELRYHIRELRLEGGRVYLEGEVRSHGEADRLAASLRQGGFEVELPHSQQLPDNLVSVQLDAVRYPAPTPSVSRASGGDGL